MTPDRQREMTLTLTRGFEKVELVVAGGFHLEWKGVVARTFEQDNRGRLLAGAEAFDTERIGWGVLVRHQLLSFTTGHTGQQARR